MTVLLARYHDFEVEADGPYFTVKFPQYGGNYYITHTTDHEEAMKAMGQFIAEAQQALEELEALG